MAILATDGFEEAELLEPRNALDAAGAKTTVIVPISSTNETARFLRTLLVTPRRYRIKFIFF